RYDRDLATIVLSKSIPTPAAVGTFVYHTKCTRKLFNCSVVVAKVSEFCCRRRRRRSLIVDRCITANSATHASAKEFFPVDDVAPQLFCSLHRIVPFVAFRTTAIEYFNEIIFSVCETFMHGVLELVIKIILYIRWVRMHFDVHNDLNHPFPLVPLVLGHLIGPQAAREYCSPDTAYVHEGLIVTREQVVAGGRQTESSMRLTESRKTNAMRKT
ncbi:hypothetical protein ALC57_13326, partial [Trachymyrmex cornetzi]